LAWEIGAATGTGKQAVSGHLYPIK